MYTWEREILKEYTAGKSCDMGCGREKTGSFGIDIATKAADLKCDMAKVPMPAASFDSILANHSLEHVPDTPKVLREWYRLLKPGGAIVLFVPDGEQVKACDLGDTTGDHRQLFTKPTLVKYFANAGFMVTDVARIARAIFLVARKPQPPPKPK